MDCLRLVSAAVCVARLVPGTWRMPGWECHLVAEYLTTLYNENRRKREV